MSEGIWAAVIGGVATIVAALITVWITRKGIPSGPPPPPPVNSPEHGGEKGKHPPTPPTESSFPVVTNWEEIDENLCRLETYLEAANEAEKGFARDLLRKARCLIVSNRGGRMRVGSSRFVGYAGMTRERFLAHEGKDGRETNWAISAVLGKEPAADAALEDAYRAYCQKRQIEGIAAWKRRFWRVD